MIVIITGDRHLQPPHEGDLLCGDHRVHGLGQRGQAPHHHQGRDNWDLRLVWIGFLRLRPIQDILNHETILSTEVWNLQYKYFPNF